MNLPTHVRHANGLGFILQTVARANFDQAHMGGEVHGVTC